MSMKNVTFWAKNYFFKDWPCRITICPFTTATAIENDAALILPQEPH